MILAITVDRRKDLGCHSPRVVPDCCSDCQRQEQGHKEPCCESQGADRQPFDHQRSDDNGKKTTVPTIATGTKAFAKFTSPRASFHRYWKERRHGCHTREEHDKYIGFCQRKNQSEQIGECRPKHKAPYKDQRHGFLVLERVDHFADFRLESQGYHVRHDKDQYHWLECGFNEFHDRAHIEFPATAFPACLPSTLAAMAESTSAHKAT